MKRMDILTAPSRLGRALNRRLAAAWSSFLNLEVTTYDHPAPNDMNSLYRRLRKGDVVLVEGKLLISQLVKYATQSRWSHTALYVGDELLRRGGQLRERAQSTFGPLADRLIVEALIEEGVVAGPLAKYETHNIRICRPSRIGPTDIARVIGLVLGDLGKRYDTAQFVELALLLLSPIRLGALKRVTTDSCLGSCRDLQVICSGLLAKAFEHVGCPVLPRHHSQILPRDFDLSPNFDIVNIHGTAGAEVAWGMLGADVRETLAKAIARFPAAWGRRELGRPPAAPRDWRCRGPD